MQQVFVNAKVLIIFKKSTKRRCFFEIYFFCHKNMFNNMYNSKINNVLW